MTVDSKIISRLNELIELGKRVLATRRSPTPGFLTGDFVDVQLANQWLTSCLNLLSRVLGENSAHYQRIKEQFPEYPKWANVDQAFGVLLAAKDDYESGSIFSVKTLIEAEVFDEFLGQAEHLLEAGYFQPAAVLAGSVLEDGLRKLCIANDITLPDKAKLDWMNSELAKKGKYSKLMQKRITTIADLRNSAAHGKWDEFEKADVESMLRDVRDFMTKHYD
ncbi:HEPN domain protein [Paraburkholderia xenovorans LB400]|uniref:HEPN domain-containing protein n=1 Tax=Paraburkholderia xenovorans TaxID=36873 RepID=UPI0004F74B4B|nr:HEPN domain-containing protein [Paraburkholderia xenovorans]AIP33456.1 HEPN domain protein [Paraburkholderia xenovorans LB400]